MNFWQGLTHRARIGLIGGSLAIVLATAVLAWWLLHTEYQALFTDLKPQDAQAMTTELERLKGISAHRDVGCARCMDRLARAHRRSAGGLHGRAAASAQDVGNE